MQNLWGLIVPKKDVNKKRFEDIKSILNLIENGEATFLSEDNGAAGFSASDRKTYDIYEDIEEVAESLNSKNSKFMTDIAKIAILYDKSSPFDRAQDTFVRNFKNENFIDNVDAMLSAYKNHIESNNSDKSIDLSLNSFYKSYKKAQVGMHLDPKFVAEKIFEIIKIMLSRMKLESRPKSMQRIREKIRDYNAIELSDKKSPGGAAVGVSLALIKNILIARDTFFIKRVIDELILITR